MKQRSPSCEEVVTDRAGEPFARMVGDAALTLEKLAIEDWRPVAQILDEPGRTAHIERATPEEHALTARILAGLVEVIDGYRPLRQVQDHITPQLFLLLQNRRRHVKAPPHGYRLRTVHTYKPQPKIIEACGTAANACRARAVAARLEHLRYGWVCTTATLL